LFLAHVKKKKKPPNTFATFSFFNVSKVGNDMIKKTIGMFAMQKIEVQEVRWHFWIGFAVQTKIGKIRVGTPAH
jgi:hypothetical protein